MENQNYHEWKPTAQLLQLLLQMMGKTKLVKMPAQPEWGHIQLFPTASGYTTGAVPDGEEAFTITLDVYAASMQAASTNGRRAGFRFGGSGSVASYYADFGAMMAHISHPCSINPVPQECFTTVPFHQQEEITTYNAAQAAAYFAACTLAYNGLLAFTSPYRGKKILPGLFWGTFDVSAILFSGKPAPFSGRGIIPTQAFDEEMVELGYWPGDEKLDEPSFYVLPYPFLQTAPDTAALRTKGAYYSAEKMEFLLPLQAVLETDDPVGTIRTFCSECFGLATSVQGWDNLAWFTQPLG